MDAGKAGGYADGTFRPNAPVTRAEFMAFTNRAFGFSAEKEISYSDVQADAWYAGVVRVAAAAGYISGYPDGTMKPGANITRQEAAAILTKVAYLTADAAAVSGFSDKASIPSWSAGFVGAVANTSLMVGYPDGSFQPGKNITRAEAVMALDKSENYLTAYDEAGTYGPEQGSLILNGNVVVRVPDVTLRNVTIKGDLILDKGIGEGDVTLENVTVEGHTYVRGGGANSIHIIGGQYNNIFVEKSEGKVRVVATNAEGIKVVLATQSEDDDSEVILEGSFDSVTVSAPEVKVTLQGTTTVKELVVAATATTATVNTTSTVTVEKATVETKATFTGTGTIKEATGTAASETTYETEPEKVTSPDSGTVTPPSTGGSSGGGSSSPAFTLEHVRISVKDSVYSYKNDLTSLDDLDVIDFLEIHVDTLNQVTIKITGVSSERTQDESWNSFQREFVQNGQLIQIEPGQLFPELSHTTVKVGTMRAIFGSYVEISGEISANGRTLSLTEKIQLTAE